LRSRVLSVLIAVVVCLIGTALVTPAGLFVATASAQAPAIPAAVEPATPRQASPDDPQPALQLVDYAAADAVGVSRHVLDLAVGAVTCAVNSGSIPMPPTLTLIDYSKPSTERRLWVFDLTTRQVRFHELVAHGKGTGENLAQYFSDDMNSHQSSLGLFVTSDTYIGSNGYSLRLDGLEQGFNSRARERAIVMHGAPYVDAAFAAKQGRIGRSWGCPALSEAVARQVIDFVRGGGVIFSYYPDEKWLQQSKFLNCGAKSAPSTVVSASRRSATSG
jgi:hypothetical protein